MVSMQSRKNLKRLSKIRLVYGSKILEVLIPPELWFRLAIYSVVKYGKIALSKAVEDILRYYLDNVARMPNVLIEIKDGEVYFKGFEPLEPGDGRDAPKTVSTITAKTENMGEAQQKPRPGKLPKYLEDNPWISILSKVGGG